MTNEEIRKAILKAAFGRHAFVVRPMPIPIVEEFEAELRRMRSDGLIEDTDANARLTLRGRVAAGADRGLLPDEVA